MSLKAYRVLQRVEAIVGYHTYLKLVDELIQKEQEIVSTGMTKEKERCRQAIKLAEQGKKVAIISSGDPGVYGMAGLILEILLQQNLELDVEVLPGITAANAAASSLGAPLMHDYAVISLSNHLTPWDVIEKRLHSAGESDMIVALYNPKSSQRLEQIKLAQQILLKYRNPDTPVGIVRKAKRGKEEISLTTLKAMLTEEIDMLTTVIIGNSQTYTAKELMVTPRGYRL